MPPGSSNTFPCLIEGVKCEIEGILEGITTAASTCTRISCTRTKTYQAALRECDIGEGSRGLRQRNPVVRGRALLDRLLSVPESPALTGSIRGVEVQVLERVVVGGLVPDGCRWTITFSKVCEDTQFVGSVVDAVYVCRVRCPLVNATLCRHEIVGLRDEACDVSCAAEMALSGRRIQPLADATLTSGQRIGVP